MKKKNMLLYLAPIVLLISFSVHACTELALLDHQLDQLAQRIKQSTKSKEITTETGALNYTCSFSEEIVNFSYAPDGNKLAVITHNDPPVDDYTLFFLQRTSNSWQYIINTPASDGNKSSSTIRPYFYKQADLPFHFVPPLCWINQGKFLVTLATPLTSLHFVLWSSNRSEDAEPYFLDMAGLTLASELNNLTMQSIGNRIIFVYHKTQEPAYFTIKLVYIKNPKNHPDLSELFSLSSSSYDKGLIKDLTLMPFYTLALDEQQHYGFSAVITNKTTVKSDKSDAAYRFIINKEATLKDLEIGNKLFQSGSSEDRWKGTCPADLYGATMIYCKKNSEKKKFWIVALKHKIKQEMIYFYLLEDGPKRWKVHPLQSIQAATLTGKSIKHMEWYKDAESGTLLLAYLEEGSNSIQFINVNITQDEQEIALKREKHAISHTKTIEHFALCPSKKEITLSYKNGEELVRTIETRFLNLR